MLLPITVPAGILLPSGGPSGQPAADAGTFQNNAWSTSPGGGPMLGSMSWKITANDTVPIGRLVILKPGIVLPPALEYFAGTIAPSAYASLSSSIGTRLNPPPRPPPPPRAPPPPPWRS